MDTLEMASESPERASCVSVPTALYRHFDSEGKLLYVGISLNAVSRLAQHRLSAAWFMEIAKIEIEWHPSREAACDAEVAAIQTERPAHNVIHVGMSDALLVMLRKLGKEHMVGPTGMLLPEFASLTREEIADLADRL